MPPVQPMLAKSVSGVPDPGRHTAGGITGLSFEPKWDGFRCVLFKDGDEVELYGYAEAADYRIGFGPCSGLILPAVE